MAFIIKIRDSQTLYDLALQHAGSLRAIHTIAQANSISVTEVLAAGQELVIPEVIREQVVRYFRDLNIIVSSQ